MRQAGFEPTTFGSGGGNGRRSLTLAVVVSDIYANRASASASQRRPCCYHRCYRGVASPSVSWSSAGWARMCALKSAASPAEDHAVQRVLSAAQNGEGQRGGQQHEFEFPARGLFAGELAVDFGDKELERAEHLDHEAERSELGQEADQHAEAAGGFGARKDAELAQHARGRLCRGVRAPPPALAPGPGAGHALRQRQLGSTQPPATKPTRAWKS